MTISLNNVYLAGTVGEIRVSHGGNGTVVVVFSLAVFPGREAPGATPTLTVVALGQLATLFQDRYGKGATLLIEGRLEESKIEGKARLMVLAHTIICLDLGSGPSKWREL